MPHTPLTQLRVRLGAASPTLHNPLPPIGGRGKGEGGSYRCHPIQTRVAVLKHTPRDVDPGSDSLHRTCSPNACSNGRKPSVCGFFVTENWIFGMPCKFSTEDRSYTCDHFAITNNGLSQ